MKLLGSLVICSIGLAACGGSGAAPKAEQDQPVHKSIAVKQPASAQLPAASQSASLSETDSLMLDQASAACKNTDFKPFFEAALRSQPVRERYFTTPIQTPWGKKTAAEYRFPIEIMDYSYIVTGSAQRGPNNWEYVKLEFNQAQDERYRVDWVRVDLGPNGNDEGETPEDDREYGPRGYLLFKPTAKCWTLVEDGFD